MSSSDVNVRKVVGLAAAGVLKEMPLRWPVLSDKGGQVEVLKFRFISRADHAAALEDDPDERTAFARFAELACGLSEREVKALKMPDWNLLRLRLSDLVSKNSRDFIDPAQLKDFSVDAPFLLQQIQKDDGGELGRIELQVPSVETTDLMQKQVDAAARTMFISRSCTGLSEDELGRLACPDWNYLQARINDFLNESADYFR